MAIHVSAVTAFGETRTLYIRLNNMEASNHGQPAVALFRGYLTKEAFESGKHYVWERTIRFMTDVSLPLWEQAYDALKMLADGEPSARESNAMTFQHLRDEIVAAYEAKCAEEKAEADKAGLPYTPPPMVEPDPLPEPEWLEFTTTPVNA